MTNNEKLYPKSLLKKGDPGNYVTRVIRALENVIQNVTPKPKLEKGL